MASEACTSSQNEVADTGAEAASSSEASTDGGCQEGHDASLSVIGLNNHVCSGPVDLCGCYMLVNGVTGGCGQPGLSPASQADMQTISSIYPLDGSVCVLQRLDPSSIPGTGCTDQDAAGWCYVQGSGCVAIGSDASVHCTQAFCETEALPHVVFKASWLSGP
jgi:hypothetical protein